MVMMSSVKHLLDWHLRCNQKETYILKLEDENERLIFKEECCRAAKYNQSIYDQTNAAAAAAADDNDDDDDDDNEVTVDENANSGFVAILPMAKMEGVLRVKPVMNLMMTVSRDASQALVNHRRIICSA